MGTFRLYEELEKAEHAQLSDQSVSYGLDEGDDKSFTKWNGTIIGPPNTNFDNRIYMMSIRCGDNYPAERPTVKLTFHVSIKMTVPSQITSNYLTHGTQQQPLR